MFEISIFELIFKLHSFKYKLHVSDCLLKQVVFQDFYLFFNDGLVGPYLYPFILYFLFGIFFKIERKFLDED